jgi:hypothetical protein
MIASHPGSSLVVHNGARRLRIERGIFLIKYSPQIEMIKAEFYAFVLYQHRRPAALL